MSVEERHRPTHNIRSRQLGRTQTQQSVDHRKRNVSSEKFRCLIYNPVLRTLFHLPTVNYEILRLGAEYGLNGVQGNLSAMKNCVWTFFVQKVRF